MPIYMSGSLIWTDVNNSFVLNFDESVIKSHLCHVLTLLNNDPMDKNSCLWMPCGDVLPDGSVIKYRLTEFGCTLLVINYNNIELVIPVSINLKEQLYLLVRSFEDEKR